MPKEVLLDSTDVPIMLTTLCLSKHKLSSKELYLPSETDDYVNWGLLVQLFVRYSLHTQGQMKANFQLALNFMQSKLDDALNRVTTVAKHGAIKDDRFLKKFLRTC
jgi:hypothetical protein